MTALLSAALVFGVPGVRIQDGVTGTARLGLTAAGNVGDFLQRTDLSGLDAALSRLRQGMADRGLSDREGIASMVDQTAAEYNVELTDREKEKITSFLLSLSQAEVNEDAVKQAGAFLSGSSAAVLGLLDKLEAVSGASVR